MGDVENAAGNLRVLVGLQAAAASGHESRMPEWERQARAKQHLDERLLVLIELVTNLAVEVEGLRQALATVAPAQYAHAYREALVLARNSAGPFSGGEKVLAGFFSDHGTELLREEPMLRRLGLSDEEIAQHQHKVNEVSTYT